MTDKGTPEAEKFNKDFRAWVRKQKQENPVEFAEMLQNMPWPEEEKE